ncbi:O-methyltransferase [Ravibacter arvi]|uniref:O-methyltransferase n=1 Tax=Ravibacter arvi TaxID=2051041 RepID=A0ABP8LMK5_9BACT
MSIIPTELENYAEAHTDPESDLLKQINRETYAQVLHPLMLSGHLQGRLLSLLSKLIRPRRILEIGTFTGYSAICLAEGLAEDGLLFTIEANEEMAPRINQYFSRTDKSSQLRPITGNAIQVIPTLRETWDLVFIDADKANYSTYFDLVVPAVRKGGLIIADNVLWKGKVVEQNDGKSSNKNTDAILAFNEKVHRDERVSNLLLPVRDGLLIIQKN